MDQMNNGQVPVDMPQKKSKTTLIIIAVVIILVLAIAWWQMGGGEEPAMTDLENAEVPTNVSPEVPEGTLEDTTPVIQQELESIDTGDLEKEFEQIDQDLNNL
jgi:multidrug resistance efflux pump